MATAPSLHPSSRSDEMAISFSSAEAKETRRRLLLGLTGELSDRLDDLSARTGYEPGELINLALALMKLALDAVEGGKQVGVAAEGQDLELEFTGFHKNDPIA